jgi:hypothetical protein
VETALPIERKAIVAAAAWPGVARKSTWPGCMHRLSTILPGAAVAVGKEDHAIRQYQNILEGD